METDESAKKLVRMLQDELIKLFKMRFGDVSTKRKIVFYMKYLFLLYLMLKMTRHPFVFYN